MENSNLNTLQDAFPVTQVFQIPCTHPGCKQFFKSLRGHMVHVQLLHPASTPPLNLPAPELPESSSELPAGSSHPETSPPHSPTHANAYSNSEVDESG
ncbi:hypothetical protein JVU11DRAFT_10899 [Chiua virens]|nr:hypothetical protein JVU11DRAFT_10899 [Chiua virens]